MTETATYSAWTVLAEPAVEITAQQRAEVAGFIAEESERQWKTIWARLYPPVVAQPGVRTLAGIVTLDFP